MQNVNTGSGDLNYTVVYAPAYTQTSKTVNETINYVDKNGNAVAPKSTVTPITFVMVTNPVDGSTKTYYSTTNTTTTLDNNGVPTGIGWTAADNADFAAVANPTVKGYNVISNNAPASDLTQVAMQNVNTGSGDLNFTVVYDKTVPTPKPTPKPNVPVTPVTPVKPVTPVTPNNGPKVPVTVIVPGKPTPQTPVIPTKSATPQQATLPKTDETRNQVGILAGIVGVMLTFLGFLGIKKKQQD